MLCVASSRMPFNSKRAHILQAHISYLRSSLAWTSIFKQNRKTGNLVLLLFYSFFPIISNDWLELLSKIRTPKLREWGKNYLAQIFYFLFYPSSGTAGIMPRNFSTRVRHHGQPHGFNLTTYSKELPQVLHLKPKQLRPSVIYDPSHGRPNR